jgi:hypothetical protein
VPKDFSREHLNKNRLPCLACGQMSFGKSNSNKDFCFGKGLALLVCTLNNPAPMSGKEAHQQLE